MYLATIFCLYFFCNVIASANVALSWSKSREGLWRNRTISWTEKEDKKDHLVEPIVFRCSRDPNPISFSFWFYFWLTADFGPEMMLCIALIFSKSQWICTHGCACNCSRSISVGNHVKLPLNQSFAKELVKKQAKNQNSIRFTLDISSMHIYARTHCRSLSFYAFQNHINQRI